MSAFGRAGMLSLGLHAAVFCGLYFDLGGSGTPTAVGAPTRSGGVSHDVGVVTLAIPEVRPQPVPTPPSPPAPLPQPVVTAQTTLPAPPPLPQSIARNLPADVRPAAHVGPAAASSPAAHSSGPRAVTFFAVPAQGKSIVYVIDRSSSMGIDGRFDRAREQVIASLRQLPADARFQVIAYDRTALALDIGGRGLAVATPANVETAAAALAAMFPEGATDHVRALRQALLLRPEVIYFLTDEDDLTAVDVANVTRFNHARVSIHALCLVAPSSIETPMRNLARQNRGEFRVVGP
jgi:hypothetical protein